MVNISCSLRFAFVAVLVAQTAAWGQGPPSTCSVQTLSGEYVFNASGHFADFLNRVIPMAELGTFTFNGADTVSGSVTLSPAASPKQAILSGRYDLNADCTGVISLDMVGSNLLLARRFTIVVLDRGRSIVSVDLGSMVAAPTWQRK